MDFTEILTFKAFAILSCIP